MDTIMNDTFLKVQLPHISTTFPTHKQIAKYNTDQHITCLDTVKLHALWTTHVNIKCFFYINAFYTINSVYKRDNKCTQVNIYNVHREKNIEKIRYNHILSNLGALH